jgi:hypothetical protein
MESIARVGSFLFVCLNNDALFRITSETRGLHLSTPLEFA